MAASATPRKLRNVGSMEQYCTHRHHLNFYTCVVTSAFYVRRSKPWSPERALHLQQLVYEALHKLIAKHPSLSVSIQDEKASKPWFSALDKVDLDRVVHVHNEERDMDEIAYHELERDFKAEIQRGGPCWRVVVVPGTVDDVPGFWVVWAFHHALADGMGGFVFHRDLLRVFNSGEIDDPRPTVSPIVELASPVSKEQLIPPMEELHKFPLGLGYVLKAVRNEYLPFHSPDPKTWTCGDNAKPEYFTPPPSSPGLRTELLSLRLTAEIIQGVLNETRSKSTSVTALLEALLSLAFLEAFPNSDKVRLSIIVSARRWLGNQLAPYGGADDVMGIYVTQFAEDFTRAAFQLSNPIPSIWTEAKRARATIDRILTQSGKNTEGGLLRFIGSYDSFFKSKIGQRRTDSFEVSNVGVFKSGASGKETWGIGDVRFSQSASVTGVAVECSIVTLEGGAMNIAFTWQEGLATKEEMGRVLDRTKALLEMIGAEGVGK